MKMRKRSLICDVRVGDWEDQGPPILFTNPEIRKMLSLSRAGKRDVFYDLGSGWGQNLIIALTEYKVAKAIGIENDRERHAISLERLKKWKIPHDRGTVICESFEKVLSGRVKGVDPHEATVVFYGLATDSSILKRIARNLGKGSRLVYYYKCLFPEIMPDHVDFPFYVSNIPFKPPRSQYHWLSSIVRKKQSSLRNRRKPTDEELWDELTHDYDVEGIKDPVSDYKPRLEGAVAAREAAAVRHTTTDIRPART